MRASARGGMVVESSGGCAGGADLANERPCVAAAADRARAPRSQVWIGGLEAQVTEEILWELFIQCGPVGEAVAGSRGTGAGAEEWLRCAVALNMPRDKITNIHQGYAFCEYNRYCMCAP
jgi:RNA recognition motif-containing protein